MPEIDVLDKARGWAAVEGTDIARCLGEYNAWLLRNCNDWFSGIVQDVADVLKERQDKGCFHGLAGAQ